MDTSSPPHGVFSTHNSTTPRARCGGVCGGVRGWCVCTVLYCMADLGDDPCRISIDGCMLDRSPPYPQGVTPFVWGAKITAYLREYLCPGAGSGTPPKTRRPKHGKGSMQLTPACVLEKLVVARRTREKLTL